MDMLLYVQASENVGLPSILFFGSSMTIFFSIFSHQLNAKKILPFFFF